MLVAQFRCFLLIFLVESSWENIFYIGHVDWSEPFPIHGSDCSLDSGNNNDDTKWISRYPDPSSWSYWFPKSAWSAWWQAPCTSIYLCYGSSQYHKEGIQQQWHPFYLVHHISHLSSIRLDGLLWIMPQIITLLLQSWRRFWLNAVFISIKSSVELGEIAYEDTKYTFTWTWYP